MATLNDIDGYDEHIQTQKNKGDYSDESLSPSNKLAEINKETGEHARQAEYKKRKESVIISIISKTLSGKTSPMNDYDISRIVRDADRIARAVIREIDKLDHSNV